LKKLIEMIKTVLTIIVLLLTIPLMATFQPAHATMVFEIYVKVNSGNYTRGTDTTLILGQTLECKAQV